ncbi:MAG: hypothetical protein DRG87_06740 [Deltaproteobacteria bacterium]|nr:hypothetical protein [Deltaproteobacteria bacterium]MBW2078934.1 hypothetical protein [Deltaproteobacteria bacterium]RLB29636.1 MAG: hypothetical protein DRG87_06740 [Deltaproteobacteria bacterium]
MKTRITLFNLTILTFCLIFLFCSNEVLAGGRSKPAKHVLSDSILFTSWYRNGVVNVAVCNVSDNTHSLKIATGTYDVERHIYASQVVEMSPRSIKLTYFPLLKQKTSRGDLKASDYIFVFNEDPGTHGIIGFKTIQNIYAQYANASLDNFLVASREKVRFSYTMEPDQALRLIFISKLLKINGNELIPGEPAKRTLCAATIEDIRELSLPISYEKQLINKLEGNYCFIIKSGWGGTAAVIYNIDEISTCSLVAIPVYRYIFEPGGGLSQGGGRGLTFLAYNPHVIEIKTLLNLSNETTKGIYRLKE